MLKRYAQIMFFAFTLVLVYNVYKNVDEEQRQSASWHGLKKVSKDKIVATPIPSRVHKENSQDRPEQNTKTNRAPASLTPHSPFTDEAPEWKKSLGEELLNIEEENAEIFIKEEKKISKIENNKLNKYRHVTIQILRKNSPSSSYEALIDNQGRIQKTWARTKFEPARDKKETFIEI